MARINTAKTGIVFALFLGGMHVLWSLCVAVGLAQPLIDFVFWMHFIKPVFAIEPFAPIRALVLIVVTATIGYVLGSVFALLWNALHK